MDIAKINFAMTYLTGVAQDWFEVGLNQEDQDILQDWLSDWNLFVDELCWHFGLSDPIGEVANMLDNLYMKPGNKISIYNVDFMHYASQLGWGNSVLCHRYYQGLPNRIQDPISTQEQGKFTLFQDIYAKIVDGELHFLFSLYFSFYFILFYFPIFRTTQVRVHQSRCHMSHKLME